jgi:hypothetical protein
MKEEILELGKLKINYKEFEAKKTDFSNDEDSSFADILILH